MMKTSKLAIVAIAFSPILFLFTNAAPTMSDAQKLAMYQQSSLKFEDMLKTGGFSPRGQEEIAMHKHFVDRLIATHVQATSCRELLAAAPTFHTGTYHIYRYGTNHAPVVTQCIRQAQFQAQAPFQSQPQSQSLSRGAPPVNPWAKPAPTPAPTPSSGSRGRH